jgi:dipeptidase E
MIVLNGGSYYPDSEEVDLAWISKISKEDLIMFIPAATTRSQEEYYHFFKQKMSCYNLENIEYVDLYTEWKRARDAKVLYIAGGNTYKLIDIVRKSGFGDFLKSEGDKRIIVGNSAGAVVLGGDIRTTNDNDITGVEDTNGVGLVEYSICPHYSKDKEDRLVNLSRILPYGIIGITEKSGIVIENKITRKIGLTKEIGFTKEIGL